MNIEQARKEVFEYMKMCGVGQTSFTLALQTLYDESLKLESKLGSAQASYRIMKQNYKDFFDYMNEWYGF